MTKQREQKIIGGVLHSKYRCCWCKEYIWQQVQKGMRDDNFVCGSCLQAAPVTPGTGGGFRVVRKGSEMS